VLLDIFQQQVKAAIYRYKSHRRLTGIEVRTIFPDAKDAETTIGRWRPQAEERN
jgi:hypothetical protein